MGLEELDLFMKVRQVLECVATIPCEWDYAVHLLAQLQQPRVALELISQVAYGCVHVTNVLIHVGYHGCSLWNSVVEKKKKKINKILNL